MDAINTLGANSGVADNRLLFVLDEIEKRIENFRQTASSLEQEKEDLLQALHMLGNSKELVGLTPCELEEIQVNAERLAKRCLTVEVSVSVPRSEVQEEALAKVKKYLDKTRARITEDVRKNTTMVYSMLNACTNDMQNGPVDVSFQAILLECAAEDQKKIKKQLQKWHETLLKTEADLHRS